MTVGDMMEEEERCYREESRGWGGESKRCDKRREREHRGENQKRAGDRKSPGERRIHFHGVRDEEKKGVKNRRVK